MRTSLGGKAGARKTQSERSQEILAFAAKRKEAIERAAQLREERKHMSRDREVPGANFPLVVCT